MKKTAIISVRPAFIPIMIGIAASVILSGCTTQIENTIDSPPELFIPSRSVINPDPLAEEILKKEASGDTKERGPVVSGNYFDTDIRAILMELSAQSGMNIIPDQTVQGMLTLSFTDVPLENVLNMILFPGGYSHKKKEGYYIVGSADPKNPSSAHLMTTESIVTNGNAGAVLEALPAMYRPYVSVSNEMNNRITINAPEHILWEIKKAVSTIDSARKLIAIDVVVAEISRSKGVAVGLDWGDPIVTFSAGGGLSGESGSSGNTFGVNGAITADISLTLSAMGKMGTVDIRANPKIVALDGETALVEIADNSYISIVDEKENLQSTEVKMVNSGISLTVFPRITRDGEILLHVEPVVSSRAGPAGTGGLPTINSRRTKTTVKLRSEETFILGGLIQEVEQRETKNGSHRAESIEKELVIFLTPKIL